MRLTAGEIIAKSREEVVTRGVYFFAVIDLTPTLVKYDGALTSSDIVDKDANS